MRDRASNTFVLMLKSRIQGENPCNVEKVFRKIKQFGGRARQAGGADALEMALMDLAGKAYGVPTPCIQNGYIAVPETPGLGIDLNLDVIGE